MINPHVADGRSHKKLLSEKDKGSQRQHILRALDSVSSVVDLRRPSSNTIGAT